LQAAHPAARAFAAAMPAPQANQDRQVGQSYQGEDQGVRVHISSSARPAAIVPAFQ
jgi:hypothetical protein